MAVINSLCPMATSENRRGYNVKRWLNNISLSLVCIVLILEKASCKVESTGPDGYAGTLSYGGDMNDEGDFSEHMPKELKCDACILIAKKLTENFDMFHKKRPSLKYLPESELLELVDKVCNDKFEEYGIKEVRGVKRLSGPGLETHGSAGVLQAGGKWPERLTKMCANYMGVVGEDEIYKKYKKYSDLTKYLCYGSGTRGECRHIQNPDTSQKNYQNGNREKPEL